jgi:predicted MFS family arabinose efflux permease
MATVAMASATVMLAVVPSSLVVIIVAAALFGAAYISLTGLLLLWSVRLYADRTSFGVGLSFFTIAAGQALGAPAVGSLIDVVGPSAAFVAIALVGLCAVALRPARVQPPRT